LNYTIKYTYLEHSVQKGLKKIIIRNHLNVIYTLTKTSHLHWTQLGATVSTTVLVEYYLNSHDSKADWIVSGSNDASLNV